MNIPIKKIQPNFEELVEVIKGKKSIERALYAELLIDEEIQKEILENVFNDKYFPPPITQWGDDMVGVEDYSEKMKAYKRYYEKTISFYYRMGYSLIPDLTFVSNFESLNTITQKTEDTATLSKGNRHWANEGAGMIKSWDNYENFPWKVADNLIEEYLEILEFVEKILPDGMKIGVVATLFEEPLEWIFGYENFFLMLTDKPDLVLEVFNRVGSIMAKFYESVISHKTVGCIFHADDLGYKTGTMISINDLNNLVFPWFKEYVNIAHKYNKPFFIHSCGKKDEIMDILIDDIGIDAIHSFEDVSYPVTRYKKEWGKRVGIIGGVDVDKLVRYSEQDLRGYVKSILDCCIPGGRYIFGSGNSVPNYVPVKNYLIMLDECMNWFNNNY